MKYPNRTAVLSDIHGGSKWGLLGPKTPHGKQNVGQVYMYDCLIDLAKLHKPVDLLVLNGDMIHGKQWRSAYTGIVTADMSEQAEIAEECVQAYVDIAKPKKIIRLEGTSSHEGFDGALKGMDKHFGIKRVKTEDPRRFVRDIQLDCGAVLNVKHKPEGEAALYRGTTQDRELLWAKLTEACKSFPRATHVLRSHLHSSGYFRGFGKEMIMTPGWMLQPPYDIQRRYYRYQPDIGGTLIVRHEMGYHDHIVFHKSYPLPTSSRRAESYASL